jgi:hypothetical protein
VNGIVVDASVTLSWCFPDEQTPLSLRVLDRLNTGEQALAPAFWPLEVLNSLLIGERRGGSLRNRRTPFSGTFVRYEQPSTMRHWSGYAGRSRQSAATMA